MSVMESKYYGPQMAAQIEAMGLLAEQIADRWASGWPAQTRVLLDKEVFPQELERQMRREKDVMAKARDMTHLAPHEILQEFGISLAPPTM